MDMTGLSCREIQFAFTITSISSVHHSRSDWQPGSTVLEACVLRRSSGYRVILNLAEDIRRGIRIKVWCPGYDGIPVRPKLARALSECPGTIQPLLMYETLPPL